MGERTFYVYMLASQRNGTLYVGVTGDLAHRVWMHREGKGSAFTSKYGVHRLVWYSDFPTALEAIAFEKRLKRWRRAWKLAKIEQMNPQWLDLYETFNC
ncbi:MAG TPA: GIY-YIG nuclease family protein [Caulobacteraceae bacterium]